MGWAETHKPVPQFREEQCLGRMPFLFLLLENTGPQSHVPPAAESQCPRSSEGQFPQPPTSVTVQHLRQNTRSLHQSSSRLHSQTPSPIRVQGLFQSPGAPRVLGTVVLTQPPPRGRQRGAGNCVLPSSSRLCRVLLMGVCAYQGLPDKPPSSLAAHCPLPPLWFSHPSDTMKRALLLKLDTRGQPQVPS